MKSLTPLFGIPAKVYDNLRAMNSIPVPGMLLQMTLCAGLLFSFSADDTLAAPPAGEFVAKLEAELLEPLVAEAPGAAVVVVIAGKVVLQKTWGVRADGEPAPITPSTLFRIASLSKTFAAAAGSILVRERPIDWETPISRNLSNLNFKRKDYGARINLKHLMSQTTGLVSHAYTNLIEDNVPYEQIIGRLNQVDFVCQPGTCYSYQNVVFSLIGDVVQATAQVSYADYVTQKLFRPLRMQRASFGREAFLMDSNHAEPHVWDGRRWSPTRTTEHYYRVAPAAGVNASIDDMRAWLLAQLGQSPTVLSGDMLDEMQQGVIKTSQKQAHYRQRAGLGDVYYGLGWRIFDYENGGRFVHHGGYVRGMRSEMVFNRELQMGFVYLTNSEPRHLGDLVFDFVDLYQRELPARTQVASVVE